MQEVIFGEMMGDKERGTLRHKPLVLIILILSSIFFLIMAKCDKKEDNGDTDIIESNWTFTEDGVNFGIAGVSAEAIFFDDGSVRLYVTDIGMKVYTANDGLNFTEETATLPQGSDPTLIRLNDGTYRMYFVDKVQSVQGIWTATSADGLNWTLETGTGIINATEEQAWGVPDSIELPDGSIRLYWVDVPSGAASKSEVIKSAISANGVNFIEESGYRTENGYVDPYIMVAEDGNWIGLFATTPASERLPQKIYVGTSADGLAWTIESAAVIAVPGGNALDPTAVPLGDGSYRVYYSATPGNDPFSGFFMKSGILKRKPQ